MSKEIDFVVYSLEVKNKITVNSHLTEQGNQVWCPSAPSPLVVLAI
jgi:hypothetical protein